MSLSSLLCKSILKRIEQLSHDCANAQYKEEFPFPHDHSIRRGQYPSHLSFGLTESIDSIKLFENIKEANGSTLMGLWFLSQSHELMRELDDERTVCIEIQIEEQLRRAEQVLLFFQGYPEDHPDILHCPIGSAGWYPLREGYRLPAVIPNALEELATQFPLAKNAAWNMANMSDGDLWSWYLSINETTPGFLLYNDFDGQYKPYEPKVYEPLLGSQQETRNIDTTSLDYYHSLTNPTDTNYPIGTFYGPSPKKGQHFSAAVNANILAAIPWLGDLRKEHRQDIEHAMAYIRNGLQKVLSFDGAEQTEYWQIFAYDYYTIRTATPAYISRAHWRIERTRAQRNMQFPTLLDESTAILLIDFLCDEGESLLQELPAGFAEYDEDFARAYARLVFCFHGAMTLWSSFPTLCNTYNMTQVFIEQLAQRLLIPCPAAYEAPGTGPYPVGPLWVSMASICFIAPTLIEAYTLYLLSQKP